MIHLPLPNLVIAGVTKAGTTSLFHYLAQHPDVGAADVKEVDHFAPLVHGDGPPPLTAYAEHFRHVATRPWRLEASPRYFIGGPPLIQRLADDLPDVRVLIAIREPVARMWSSYTYKRSKDRLPGGMNFAGFVEACRAVYDGGLVRDPGHAAFRTLASGVYADYLGDWFDVLGDRVRVVFFETLTAEPVGELQRLAAWLGLDPRPLAGIDTQVRNATVQPRSQLLRRAALQTNRILGPGSVVKTRLRSAYTKVNTSHERLELTSADREQVRAFYRPTLPPLRRLLAARGGPELPPWLADVTP